MLKNSAIRQILFLVVVLAVVITAFQNCGSDSFVAAKKLKASALSSSTQSCVGAPVLGTWTEDAAIVGPNPDSITFSNDCTGTDQLCGSRFEYANATASAGTATIHVVSSNGNTSCLTPGTYTCVYGVTSLVAQSQLAFACGSSTPSVYFQSAGGALPTPTPIVIATPTPNPLATFANLNSGVFQPKCVSCHSAANASGGYSMSTYAGVMSQVVPGNPLTSQLSLRTASGLMPPSGTLTTDQKAAIAEWIARGALNN